MNFVFLIVEGVSDKEQILSVVKPAHSQSNENNFSIGIILGKSVTN